MRGANPLGQRAGTAERRTCDRFAAKPKDERARVAVVAAKEREDEENGAWRDPTAQRQSPWLRHVRLSDAPRARVATGMKCR
jgi:hypothetical protein